MKHLIFLLTFLLCLTTSFAQSGQTWITNASGVRARSAPAITGEEVLRLPIGTILKQIDNEQPAAKVSEKNDFWYHVSLANGKEGWIFGAFVVRFEEKNRGEIYQQIATAKLKIKDAGFAEWADLTRFLTAATTEISERRLLAELELARLLALQKAFEKIPVEKLEQPEFQRFVKTYQANAAYSEPSGLWLVTSDLLWSLQKKYADLPVAENIAWAAANLPIPGECEDDDSCHMALLNMTLGRYLQLYPKGKHAVTALDKSIESLQGINEMMKHIQTPKGKSATDNQIRKDALATGAKMRANIAQVINPQKAKVLRLLAQYEKNYR